MPLAELMAEQHDLLAARFVEAARALPESEGIGRVELLDSMAFFLDDVVEVLAGEGRISPRASAAASHGVERLAIGFRIDQVVREYLLIARLVLELAAQHGVIATDSEQQLLLRAVGDGAATAAAEYMRRREAELMARESQHTGFLAHELRNSLASARFAFELLRRRDFARAEELERVVDTSLKRAARQVDDALSGVRLRGGVVTQVRVFVGLMVHELVSEVRPQADAKQITIEIDAPERIAVDADPHLTRSALANLIGNAVKFTRPGGTISLRAVPHGGEVLVEVEDRCGGLSPETMERMFAPFVQTSPDRSGHGLGLAIAREAAEAQGGSVKVRNLEGQGCVLTLVLPART